MSEQSQQDHDMQFVMVKPNERPIFVVGELLRETQDALIVRYPILIGLMADDNNQPYVSTAKFFPFSEDNIVTLMKNQFMGVSSPKPNIIEYYHKFKAKYGVMLETEMETRLLASLDADEAKDDDESSSASNEVSDSIGEPSPTRH